MKRYKLRPYSIAWWLIGAGWLALICGAVVVWLGLVGR